MKKPKQLVMEEVTGLIIKILGYTYMCVYICLLFMYVCVCVLCLSVCLSSSVFNIKVCHQNNHFFHLKFLSRQLYNLIKIAIFS